MEFVEDIVAGTVPEDESLDAPEARKVMKRGSQKEAPWPLYQHSAKNKDPEDHTYYYLDKAGEGVDIYILDSGIARPQDEFDDDRRDRVVLDINFSNAQGNGDDSGITRHGTRWLRPLRVKDTGWPKAQTSLISSSTAMATQMQLSSPRHWTK